VFRSRSHDAVIRVYDAAGNVIETHEHKGIKISPKSARKVALQPSSALNQVKDHYDNRNHEQEMDQNSRRCGQASLKATARVE